MSGMILWLALAFIGVLILVGLAYYWGYQTAKNKKFAEIGTVDELVQDAVNRTLIKVGRDDKVNVADIERYLAIVILGKAILINLDNQC